MLRVWGTEWGDCLSRAGLRGVAQTPLSVVRGGRETHAAGPSSRGEVGRGWADPGASRAESEPAPAPSLQPCVAAALGVGSLSLMAQSWAWVGTTPPQKSQAHPGGGGMKRPDPKPLCYWLGC